VKEAIRTGKETAMPRHRHALPQLADRPFLTDGGMETDLIFHHGIDLPCMAAYTLLGDDAGVARLTRYFEDYVAIARTVGWGLVLESVTWRANPDWAERIGTPPDALPPLNRAAIDMLAALRRRHGDDALPMVISGCVGPRSDGYRPTEIMTVAQAEAYHGPQIRTFADTEADLVTAMTITNTPEAVGIARAARAAGMPVAISFTVETDGRLPTGERPDEAIDRVDEATGGAPAYYMINCAHPTHFAAALEEDAAGRRRIRGLRANSSAKSHAELDESPELDEGDPVALGQQYRALRRRFPHLGVLGGCCGTDHRHVREIALACAMER
jgi:S-methylmethionine-dependent homocysteine/selenocysteine methylase